jgi:hypothetical protein
MKEESWRGKDRPPVHSISPTNRALWFVRFRTCYRLGRRRCSRRSLSFIFVFKDAIVWLWNKLWGWGPLAWIVSSLFITAGIVLVQEHIFYAEGRGLFVAGAFVVLVKVLHDAFVAKRPTSQIVVISVIVVAVLGGAVFIAWNVVDTIEWKNEVVIKMTFKSSLLFTEKEQRRIIWNLNKYFRYLEDLGFDFPKEIPPLELCPPNSVVMGGGSPGPAYLSSLIIPENTINTPDVLREGYSSYIFNRVLTWPDAYKAGLSRAEAEDDEEAASIFACYFPASFSGHRICGTEPSADENNWNDALWELRRERGKDDVDQLLYYTFVSWNSLPAKHPEKFDLFFRYHLTTGGIVKGVLGIEPLLKRHGIDVTPL